MTMTPQDRHRIDTIPISTLSHHGAECCDHGRRTIRGRLARHPDLGSRIAAVPELFEWGPVCWPHHWCELATSRDRALVGDCGVHAALISDILQLAGQAHSRGRAALRPDPLVPVHWRARWQDSRASSQWVDDDVVHHEVIRVADRWWDPSEARWFAGVGARLASGWVVGLREEHGAWTVLDEQEPTGADPTRK